MPRSSVELAFTSESPGGLKIVPASCPSDPHTAAECYAQPYYQATYTYVQPYYQTSYVGGYSQSSYTPGYSQSYYQAYYQASYVTCTAQNFCSGNNLYHRDANCVDTLIQACTYGCSGSTCNPTPAPAITLQVTPLLVSSGSLVRVVWTSVNTTSCSLTENNPHITDSWTTLNGSQNSSAITEQTVYTLSCSGLDGSSPSLSRTVNVIPVWQER